MDRSQENAAHLLPKAPTIANASQAATHEIAKGSVNFRGPFPQDSGLDSNSEMLSVEKLSGKKPEQFMSPVQAPFFQPVAGAALGMSLPYGMFHGATFDPRMLYTYGSPMMSFPGFTGGYTSQQEQELKSREEAINKAKNTVAVTRSEPTNHSSKDGMRTESVIKTVADRQETKATSELADKQESSGGLGRFVDKENEKNGKNAVASRDSQALRQGEIDLSRTSVIPNRKSYEQGARENQTTSRKTNDRLGSRPYENGSFMTTDKGYVDHRSSYQSFPEGIPEKDDASSNTPSSMPKLTPIAPRVSNSSPFTVHHAAELDHRHSPASNARKQQTYAPQYYSTNSGSISVAGNVPSRGASPADRSFYRDKLELDYPWRKDKTAEDAEKLTRNYYLQQWEQRPQGMPVLTRAPTSEPPRTTNGAHGKVNGGKDLADVKGLARDSAGEPAETEQNDDPKISYSGTGHGQHPGTHVKNGKSSFNSDNYRYKLNDERKSSLQTEKVIVRDKQGMRYGVSVREDPRRHAIPELSKYTAKTESREHVTPGVGDGVVEKKEATFYPGTRADFRGKQTNDPRDDTGSKDDTGTRASESHPRISFNGHGHRTDDSKKNNDRNNNTPFGGMYPYLGLYGSSALPNGELQGREQERYGGYATFTQEKLFVPPNATLDMYERRKKEQKADQLRAKESQGSHNEERLEVTKGDGDAKDGKRSAQRGEEGTGVLKAKQPQNKEKPGKIEEISSDEEEKRNSKSESVPLQPSNRLPASSLPHRPQSSPHVVDRNGVSPANLYASAFGANLFARRLAGENDVASREGGSEGGAAALVYPGAAAAAAAANFWGAYPSQFFAAQGRGDAQPVFFDPMSYGGMCRPPMVDAASQGALIDPFAAPLVMVPHDAAYFLNPHDGSFLMDPNFQHPWAMPGSQEDPRLQYHFMQQQHQKYLQLAHQYQQQHQQQQQQRQQQQRQQQQQQQKQSQQSQAVLTNHEKPTLSSFNSYQVYLNRVKSNMKEKELERSDEEQTKARSQDQRADVTENKEKNSKLDTQVSSARDVTETANSNPPPERPLQVKGASVDETQEENKVRFQQYLHSSANYASQPPRHFPFVSTSGNLSTSSADCRSASPKTVSAAETLSSLERSRAVESQRRDHVASGSHKGAGDLKVECSTQSGPEFRVGDNSYGTTTTSRETVGREDFGSKQHYVGSGVPVLSMGIMDLGGINMKRTTKEQNEEPTRGYTLEESLLRGYERASHEDVPGKVLFSGMKSRNSLSETADNQQEVANEGKLEERNAVRKGLKILKSDTEIYDRLYSMGSHEAEGFLHGKTSFGVGSFDLEDSFSTKCELRRLESSFLPVKPDLDTNNKENTVEFSVKTIKTEAERQKIRENIDRLRRLAKRRSSKERFTVFSRRSELRSPATIVNDVTSGGSDSVGMQDGEKEMRMRLAELQKKYREKARELARLQPKGKDGDDCKSNQIKRGPGRPRKRKYFGAGSKGGKTPPMNSTTADDPSKKETSLPESEYQAPVLEVKTANEESPVVRESEPMKKKKKKASPEPDGREERLGDFTVEVLRQIPTDQEAKPTVKSKKKGASPGNQRSKTPPTVSSGRNSANLVTSGTVTPVFEERPTSERESNASLASSPVGDGKVSKTKTKKAKPKKRVRSKLKTGAPAPSEGGKDGDEMAPNGTDVRQEGERAQTSFKKKKLKGKKKKRHLSDTSPTLANTLEFQKVDSKDGFEEENSIATCDFTRGTAKATENVPQESNQEDLSENDDVFYANYEENNALNLLASFAATNKAASKGKRAETISSEKASLKKPRRPKKFGNSSPSFDSDVSPTTNKKPKKVPTKTPGNRPNLEPPEFQTESVNIKKKTTKKVKESSTNPSDEEEEACPEQMTQHLEDTKETVIHHSDDVPLKITEALADTTTVEEEKAHNEDIPPQTSEPAQDEEKKTGSSSPTAESAEPRLGFLFDDIWQPRRSERIFLSSSVTSTTSASPLSSPGGKADPDWTLKKPKRATSNRKKSAKSGSNDADPEETDGAKLSGKSKRKKGPGKNGRRRTSSVSEMESEEAGRSPKRIRHNARQRIESDEPEEEDEETSADQEQQEEELDEEEEEQVVESRQEPLTSDTPEKIAPDAWPAEPVAMETTGSGGEGPEATTTEREMETEEKQEVQGESVVEQDSAEMKPEQAEPKSDIEVQNSPNEDPKPPDAELCFMFDRKELTEGANMLLLVDGVFVRSYVQCFQDPDLFGVVVAGERGRRPHWRSTEQLLSDAVKDIKPPNLESLQVGCRVCAHWSPQYRCFYPGMVAEVPPDEKVEEGKVWIEFDDGDSGWFQLDEIRRINPDFPVEEEASLPPLPEKRSRSSVKNPSSRIKAENISEASSGNESSGEIRAKRRSRKRIRHAQKGEFELSDAETRTRDSREKRRNCGERRVSDRKTEVTRRYKNATSKEITGASVQLRTKEKNDSTHRESSSRTPTDSASKTKAEGKANSEPARNGRGTKANDSSASKQDKTGEQTNLKASDYQETECKEKRDKQTSSLKSIKEETLEQSGDGEGTSDAEKHEKRGKTKHQSRTGDMDLRRKSLTLNLNSSVRSTRAGADSPLRENCPVDDDSESCSDTFDESPQVEMKHFQPRLGKRRRSELDRLREDLKSSGKLWQWSGRSTIQNKRKGKGKKIFFKAIMRGDETISVGDCAVFMSNPTKNNNLPYVGKIESLWEGCSANMVVRVKWFYHPEETKQGRRPTDGKHSLYRSTHVDENDVQTILHKCEVLCTDDYKRRTQSHETTGTRSQAQPDRLFCCIGTYDPNTEILTME